MNNRIFIAFGLIAGLFLQSPTLQAAAGSTGADYEVEVLVFKNLMPELEGNEIWSPERVDLTLPDIDKAKKAADTDHEQGALAKAVKALQEQGKYEVLAHKRWLQTAEARSSSPLMRIVSAEGELDGTFQFYMSRFLHVDLKLVLKDMAETENLANNSFTTDVNRPASATISNDAMPTQPLLAYRIEESRRIRSNEVHYFDHPKFGVLMKITPVEK